MRALFLHVYTQHASLQKAFKKIRYYYQFGCGTLKMVGPKKQEFWPKINILKGKNCILRIQGAQVCQKLGMILGNKVVQILKLEKEKMLILGPPSLKLHNQTNIKYIG